MAGRSRLFEVSSRPRFQAIAVVSDKRLTWQRLCSRGITFPDWRSLRHCLPDGLLVFLIWMPVQFHREDHVLIKKIRQSR